MRSVIRSSPVRVLTAILMMTILFATGVITATPAFAVKVLVVVNDTPITDFDVRQRMRLNELLGIRAANRARARKRALKSLVDEAVLMGEARRLGMQADETRVEAALLNMARRMGGRERFEAALRKRGLRMDMVRDYLRAQMIFRALAARSHRNIAVKVSDAEVERRLRKILSDPRMRGVTIWQLRQIDLPVEDVSPVMREQVMLARAVEARQIMQRYRGCGSIHKAVSGIFNVKVSRLIPADPKRMPPALRKALSKAGTRHLVGPIGTRKGVQLIAYCGKKVLKAKIPDKAKLRQQIRAVIEQEKLGRQLEQFMKSLRKKAVISWRTKKT